MFTSETGLKFRDRGLFYHYATSTYLSLAHRGDAASVRRTSIPQYAHDYPFTMHAVLSLSALHLEYLESLYRQRYILAAARHQNLVL